MLGQLGVVGVCCPHISWCCDFCGPKEAWGATHKGLLLLLIDNDTRTLLPAETSPPQTPLWKKKFSPGREWEGLVHFWNTETPHSGLQRR